MSASGALFSAVAFRSVISIWKVLKQINICSTYHLMEETFPPPSEMSLQMQVVMAVVESAHDFYHEIEDILITSGYKEEMEDELKKYMN